MSNTDILTTADADRVHVAAASILVAALAGERGSVTALAAAVGLSRPTLYRRYPDEVDRFNAALTAITRTRSAPTRASRRATPDDVVRLRQQNAMLREQNELYVEVIRQLTLEIRSLEGGAGSVSDIRSHSRRSTRVRNPER
jgi:AcrR family transcriptional regulator